MAHHEQNWLDSCPLEYRPLYYGWYVDDIFILFKSSEHLKRFQSYLNSCHVNTSLAVETEQNNKLSFLDVNVIREQGKSITSVYRKPTFSGVCIHFDSLLLDTYKTDMIYNLINRCFWICSKCPMFHQQSILLREIFQKNGYPENFIDRCFKLFLNRIYISKKRFLQLKRSLCDYSFLIEELYHWKLGLNCKIPSKGYLTAVNHRLFLKDKINSVIVFALKVLFPKFLHQMWFISLSVDYAINTISENELDILL